MRFSRFYKRTTVVAIVAVMAMMLAIPAATYASESGHRNTALVLSGLSAILLSNGKTGAGLLSAAGALTCLAEGRISGSEQMREAGSSTKGSAADLSDCLRLQDETKGWGI